MDPNTQRGIGCSSTPRPLNAAKYVGQHFVTPPPGPQPSRCGSAVSALPPGKDVFGCQTDVDMLLANAGYNVKTSDLEHVAERLEQLESFLFAAQEAGISRLSSEAVHYNPSDLAGWIECMIGELAPGVVEEPPLQQRMGEFAYGGDFGSNSLDSQLDRASYVEDCSTKQASGSVSSLGVASHFKKGIAQESPAVGTIPRYHGVNDFSEMAPLEELEELQYRGGSEDQASSNLFARLPATQTRSVFPEGLDMAHVSIEPPSSGSIPKPYPQPEHQFHRQRPQQKAPDGSARLSPSPLTSEMLSFQAQSIRPQPQHQQPPDQNTQSQLCVITNGLYAQQPVVDEGAQESGIRLVHLLMACAEAIQNNELAAGHEMVREISRLASPQCGAMGKVATHFVEALARRIYNLEAQDDLGVQIEEVLYYHFYESCPYLKFAHFTANQAILEAFEGHKFVHVIDFNLMQGLQWPALIQALALRVGGPPHLRLTGIGPPQPDDKDVLQEIGMKLAQLAESVNVEFEFRGVVATKLDDVKPWMLQVRPREAVAINSILRLHRLLINCGENSHQVSPIGEVLESMKSLNPRIITVVEQEANHNSPYFLERFMQALHFYCTMFDSLEACCLPPQCSEVLLTELYLGREIVNIVACEGVLRVERHETLLQWRARMAGAGFKPLHLGSNAFKQASMLLTLFSGEGYTVEENNGCLTLGWHSRPLIASSAWQCG